MCLAQGHNTVWPEWEIVKVLSVQFLKLWFKTTNHSLSLHSPVWVRLGHKARFESDFVGNPNDKIISPFLPLVPVPDPLHWHSLVFHQAYLPISPLLVVSDRPSSGSSYALKKQQCNMPYLSLVVRKREFCICKNKDPDRLRGNREADQRLCFRYIDSTIPLLPKYKISSL